MIEYDDEGCVKVIHREYYGQGDIVKDGEPFDDVEHPYRICYIPELSDAWYCRRDLIDLCGGNEELAEEMFDTLDWQHPDKRYYVRFCEHEGKDKMDKVYKIVVRDDQEGYDGKKVRDN